MQKKVSMKYRELEIFIKKKMRMLNIRGKK